MSNYISTPKLYYVLGEKLIVTGNVKAGLLPAFSYNLYLGSAASNEEIELASGKSASDIKRGIEISLTDEMVVHASPHGEGRLCYIKIIGKRKPLAGEEETIECTTYVNLKGDLLPEFTLECNASNEKAVEFAETPVKGFSKLKVTVDITELKHGATVEKVQITGGVFSTVIEGEQESYSAELNPVETSGDIYINAAVTTNLGYTSTKSITVKVFDYKTPILDFKKDDTEDTDVEPTRCDESGNHINSSTANKNTAYALSFKGKILPCKMIVNDVQICKVSKIEKANLTEIGSYNTASNSFKTAELILSGGADEYNDGSRRISYSGKPLFNDGTEGLLTYKAYKLEITCSDSTGKNITLAYRIKTLGTAFHLGAGGNKAKFGGYATEDDTLASEWDIHAEKDIRCDGMVTSDFFKVSSGIYFSDNSQEYKGVGENADNLAQGDHKHGNISNTGYLIIGGKPVANAVLVTNEAGEIVYIEKLTTEHFVMGTDGDMLPAAGIDEAASVGTPDKGFCYANHIHPYSDAWKKDPEYISLVETVNKAYEMAKAL